MTQVAGLPDVARAMVLREPNVLEPAEFALPEIGEDDALLQVEICGLCGTDYEQFDGKVQANDYYRPHPSIPGHEPLGLIAAIGARASERWGVSLRDRVAVRSSYGCGRCEACRNYQPERCPTRGGTYGFTPVDVGPALWGAFAEYMYLHPLSVVREVDARLPAALAVMFNPLAAGLSWGASVPGTESGDRVVIMGPGQRGLCSLVAALDAGASQVIVTGLASDSHKLALARELGAHHTIVVDDVDPTDEILELTGGGASVVVDTTPFFAGALRQAIAMCARRGRIVLAGLKGSGVPAEFVPDELVYKELSVRGVLSMPLADFDRACELIEDGRYPLERLHTHAFPLAQAEQAIATLAGRTDERAIHVAIEPFSNSVSTRG